MDFLSYIIGSSVCVKYAWLERDDLGSYPCRHAFGLKQQSRWSHLSGDPNLHLSWGLVLHSTWIISNLAIVTWLPCVLIKYTSPFDTI